MSTDNLRNLQASEYFDFHDDALIQYGQELVGNEKDLTEIAKKLYLGVRDDIQYNAYTFKFEPSAFSASDCLKKGESYCIPKAVLLATLCRLYGIPARIGLADVKNHMASPQLLDYLQSDVFVMHGYTDIYLNERWVKATPAFDTKLCRLMNLKPLEFNGIDDSIFHEFDNSGSQHMEYLKDHGTFSDVPRDFIIAGITAAYPHLTSQHTKSAEGKSLAQDIQDLR